MYTCFDTSCDPLAFKARTLTSIEQGNNTGSLQI